METYENINARNIVTWNVCSKTCRKQRVVKADVTGGNLLQYAVAQYRILL